MNTMPKQINAQTPGPLAVARDQFTHLEPDLHLTIFGGFIVARVNRFAASFGDKRDEKNAALLAASYTSFDKAARALGVDAVELAQSLDLAALIQKAALLAYGDESQAVINRYALREILEKLP
jgi:hypothetical protein